MNWSTILKRSNANLIYTSVDYYSVEDKSQNLITPNRGLWLGQQYSVQLILFLSKSVRFAETASYNKLNFAPHKPFL